MNLPQVHKGVFVVDRKDLDYQTTKEFNSFSDGCIDGTDNTSNLVKQFVGTYLYKKGKAKNNKLKAVFITSSPQSQSHERSCNS